MLEDTLILFTSEFGRTPFTQTGDNKLGTGRDHNMYGFSLWMAGGGVKGGTAYGSTDEIGWKTTDNRVHWYDFTPPSCTSSAWTTNASPSTTTASNAASPTSTVT